MDIRAQLASEPTRWYTGAECVARLAKARRVWPTMTRAEQQRWLSLREELEWVEEVAEMGEEACRGTVSQSSLWGS